jgi:hypothetical protein
LYPALGTALEPLSASLAHHRQGRGRKRRTSQRMTEINRALQDQSRNHPNKKDKEEETTLSVCPIAQEFRLPGNEREREEENRKRKTGNFKKNENP